MPQADPAALELFENFQDYLALQHLYQAALKQLQIKFEVLNDEFQVRSGRSPIHHIESRLKSTASIIAKLQNRNYAVTLDSAKQNINDIAGIRVVCSYIDDVYAVAEMLLRQSDVRLVQTQDYIQHPNFNGYRSLHLDIQIPIYLSDHTEHVNVRSSCAPWPWISGPVWSMTSGTNPKRTFRPGSHRRCGTLPRPSPP